MDQNLAQTLILVGRTGNGKSATGNSILGRQAFLSTCSQSGVTRNIEMDSTTRKNGQVINVIDTPGLFDVQLQHDSVCKAIVKSMDLAKNGIHALLLVYSVTKRFSLEEEAAIYVMMDIFGPKIIDYTIVVMTGVDELTNVTPQQFMQSSPNSLKKILGACKNRHVFFDNKTQDEAGKKQQLEKLLEVVNNVREENQGLPFTNFLMRELKEKSDAPEVEYAKLLERSTITIDKTLKKSIQGLQQRVHEEDELRRMAEANQQQLAAQVNELQGELESLKASSTTERVGNSHILKNAVRVTVGAAIIATQFIGDISSPCSIM